MFRKILFCFFILLLFFSCSKKDKVNVSDVTLQDQGVEVYKQGIQAMEDGDFFYASKLFSEAESNLMNIEIASKAAILSAYSFYRINFYEDSIEGLERFISRYPASDYLSYAYYLSAMISFEQIPDEKKDLKPTENTKKKIIQFIDMFPDTEYALDLKFKLGLVNNQLAAKEMFIARYYMETQKWIPAINRLKHIIDNYEETIFIEEALHRLVEIYYKIGLEKEASDAAKLLGYNYNSSQWYEKSYAILNKDYKIDKKSTKDSEKLKEDGLVRKVIKSILGK